MVTPINEKPQKSPLVFEPGWGALESCIDQGKAELAKHRLIPAYLLVSVETYENLWAKYGLARHAERRNEIEHLRIVVDPTKRGPFLSVQPDALAAFMLGSENVPEPGPQY